MTSEVAIMNPMAVALAADSAVTYSYGNEIKKIYNSENKLFTLSKIQPIGIMVYGNSLVNQIPWEIVIKEFRVHIGSQELDKVEDYMTEFLSFTKTFITQFDPVPFFLRYSDILLQNIQSHLSKEVDLYLQTNPSIDESGIHTLLDQILLTMSNVFTDENQRINPSPEQLDIIDADYLKPIPEHIEAILGSLNLTSTLRTKIESIIKKNIIYSTQFNLNSGIVIAGYGTKDIFPVVSEVKGVQGVFVDYILYDKIDTRFGGPNYSSVIPFAQRDMVCTFLEGVDPIYQSMIVNGVISMFRDYSSILLDILVDTPEDRPIYEQQIIPVLHKHFSEWNDNLDKYRQEKFINPIIDILHALPKDELALMAESLISITSFKRRVSLERETVGGAVDVAVISKGDGFIWIKRKHYFNPSLNHQFFENYYNRIK